MCPKTFKRSAGSQNNYQFYLPNFPKFCGNISHKLLRPSEFLEKIQAPPLQAPLLNAAESWKGSHTNKACAMELSHILAKNICNARRGIGLRIYLRCFISRL